MRDLQLLIGTIENYQEEHNHPTFSRAVLDLADGRDLTNPQLDSVLRWEPIERDSMISKVVSKRVYEHCSRNSISVVQLIRDASDNPKGLPDRELVRYIETTTD